MFKKVLLPLDGSALAERVLPLAGKIVRTGGGKLILFRVVPYITVLAADPMLYEEMNRMGEDEALAYLRQVKEEGDPALAIEVVCEVGSAAESILQYAQDQDVDLIIMSSHGRSGISRWVYGSVAERVLSQAPCPILIANAGQVPWGEGAARILVPLDGSQLAEKALEPAQELAQDLGLEIHLLSVMTAGHSLREVSTSRDPLSGMEGEELKKAQDYLAGQSSKIKDVPVQTSVKLAAASVAETIIEYAAEHDIDIIVMSSHGRTGLSRWIYGSVAEKVLRSACCATMIVRSD
jgi:nucleotide-binding universal stress UspA family protein